MLAPCFPGIEIPNKTNGFSIQKRYVEQGAGRGEDLDRFLVESDGGMDESLQRTAIEAS